MARELSFVPPRRTPNSTRKLRYAVRYYKERQHIETGLYGENV